MEQFKKVLGIILGISALVMLAFLLLVTLNKYDAINLISDSNWIAEGTGIFAKIIFYALPSLAGLAAVYFVSDKNILIFILTVIFVAACLFIYFSQDAFFGFVDGIVG